MPKIKSLRSLLLNLLLLNGCSIVSIHSVPNLQAPATGEVFNAKLEADGVLIYLHPINKFTLRNTWYEQEDIGFDRNYYYPEKPAPLTYFLIELLVDPRGATQVKLDLAAVTIKEGQSHIRPVAFWKEKSLRWSVEQRKQSKTDLYQHLSLCNISGQHQERGNFLIEMQNIFRGRALDLDPRIPSCFILKFPIEPINPRIPFSIDLSEIVTVDGRTTQLPVISYHFVQTKFLPLPGP